MRNSLEGFLAQQRHNKLFLEHIWGEHKLVLCQTIEHSDHQYCSSDWYLQVELSVCGTIRQTLSSIFVEVRTVGAFPTFLADARAVDAEPVAGAGRV